MFYIYVEVNFCINQQRVRQFHVFLYAANASNRYESDTIQEDDFGEASGGLEEESRSPPNRMKPRILLVKADMGVEEVSYFVQSKKIFNKNQNIVGLYTHTSKSKRNAGNRLIKNNAK